jgi:hypothetical protein
VRRDEQGLKRASSVAAIPLAAPEHHLHGSPAVPRTLKVELGASPAPAGDVRRYLLGLVICDSATADPRATDRHLATR